MLEFGIDRYKWKSVRAPMKGLLHKLKFIHTVSLHVQSHILKEGSFVYLQLMSLWSTLSGHFFIAALMNVRRRLLFLVTILFPTKFV